jgi:hypothetical protein
VQSRDLTTLVHLLGFLTGIALYAMLGAMVARVAPGASATPTGIASRDRIPLATAALGLLWNVGGLLSYGLRDLGVAAPPPWVNALSLSALGFLPAVAVHAATQGIEHSASARWVVRIAYLLSSAAMLLQALNVIVGGSEPSRASLLLLTVGYLIVIGVLARLLRRQPGWERALSLAALALFAVSALHTSRHARGGDTWWVELIGHHASIPLALAILYQDFRFALADLFLKRALTVLSTVTMSALLYLAVIRPWVLPRLRVDALDPRATWTLIVLLSLAAAMYPVLRRGVHRFVDRVVLQRTDYRASRARIARRIAEMEHENEVLDAACDMLAPELWARRVAWEEAALELPASHSILETSDSRRETRVRVPTAAPPSYVISVMALSGGRRLLSDDFAMLEEVAHQVAHRIDALRLTSAHVRSEIREQEMLRLAATAELRALRAQLNPHFLFNALTTIAHLLRESPERALETLYRLTGLLRAVLRRFDGEFGSLAHEMEIVRSYLAIEQARLEDRLTVRIDVPDALLTAQIPPLLLQPLVENAIKHGIAPRRKGGCVAVSAQLEEGHTLHLAVSDTGVGAAPEAIAAGRRTGIGLDNIEHRLQRHFGVGASLTVTSIPDHGTTVIVLLPFHTGRDPTLDWQEARA